MEKIFAKIMKTRDLDYYWKNSHKIDGWFDPDAARIIAMFDEFQKKSGIAGSIFEIGVHHGKMTIFLGLLLRGNEKIGVCDIFDDQSHNISGSGCGSKMVFLRHWHDYFGDKEISIFQKPSRELSVVDTGTECRIFSIDGGHTAAETYKDLQTAENAVQPDGIIIIDDYFDAMYPGVSEGVNRFLSDHSGISPLMHFFNKIVMVSDNARNHYEVFLDSQAFREFMIQRRFTKSTQLFYNHDLHIFRQYSYSQKYIKKLGRIVSGQRHVLQLLEKTGIKRFYGRVIKPRG